MRVYELRGLGDAVNYKESEIPKMLKGIADYFAEYVPPPGDVIEITAKEIRPEDFKRMADE